MGRKQLLNKAGCLLRQAAQGSARSANTPALSVLPIFDLQRSMAASRCFLTTYARSSAVLGMHLLAKRDIHITNSVLGSPHRLWSGRDNRAVATGVSTVSQRRLCRSLLQKLHVGASQLWFLS